MATVAQIEYKSPETLLEFFHNLMEEVGVREDYPDFESVVIQTKEGETIGYINFRSILK